MKLKMIKVPYELIIEGKRDKSYAESIKKYFMDYAKTFQEMTETGNFIIEDYSLCQDSYKTLIDRFTIKLNCRAILIHKFRINKDYMSIYVDEYDFKSKHNYDIESVRFSLPVITKETKKIQTVHIVVNRSKDYLIAPNE